jgi:Flp pilus assembly protein TadG
MKFSNRKRAPNSQTGQAMVEFLLSIMMLMVFVFFCFEMFMLLYSYNILADAAKEGVRHAVVSGSKSATPAGPTTGTSSDCTTNVAPVKTVVTSYAGLTFHDISAMTVNVCYLDGNNKAPSRVQVKIQYPYVPYFVLPLTPTIYAAAEGRIVF